MNVPFDLKLSQRTLVFTPTLFFAGVLVQNKADNLILDDACVVFDSGPLPACIQKWKFVSSEGVGRVHVPTTAIIAVVQQEDTL